jgi:uncharacterized delta-60 repeat protein
MQPAGATFRSASAVAVLLGVASGLALAQSPGSLDPTFGAGGIVTTTVGENLATLTAIEQSNGDIAVVTGFNNVGVHVNPNEEVVGLVRYTPDGTLIGTTMAAWFANGINSPSAVAVQSNGDIVVVGTASAGIDQATEFAIARFQPDGELDPAFGDGGLVTTTPMGPFPAPSAVTVQPNGQILVGGFVNGAGVHKSGQTVLARYNSNGSLDTTFGTGGIAMAQTGVASPAALAQISNGSYLAGGGAGSVVEFSSTGVLQSTVTPGTLVAAIKSGSGSIVFQPNGDYVVAQAVHSGCVNCHDTDAQVSRFSETGVADPSFSSTSFTFGGDLQTQPQAIAIQSNGQIVVGGLTYATGTPVTGGLARLDSNGELDTTFASGGSLTSDQTVSGLLIEKNRKIVAIGGTDGNLVLARYLAN